MKILHVTAHLGGGVGRVLSRVSVARKITGAPITDSFLCLEPPEKKEIIEYMIREGIDVFVCPTPSQINQLIADADIVQLEWWHHPLMAKFMCDNSFMARLVVWCHTSGLSYPDIPLEFVYTPSLFLFTSSVSHKDVVRSGNIDTVHSSGGFDDIPVVNRQVKKGNLFYSYLGAPNFSKLHPRIIDYLFAVDIPGFKVNFFGDMESNPVLMSSPLANKIVSCGFTSDPSGVFKKSDVLIYLLNPDHYGTTENALLEAMATGVVPIVLNNPVESSIVKHKVTGMIVDSIESFANAIAFLDQDRKALKNMAHAAIKDIRERFPLKKTVQSLDSHYQLLMEEEKRSFNFSSVFGSTPHEWFFSCLGKYRKYFANIHGANLRKERLKHPVLYEVSKSSVFHFSRYFPRDTTLMQWADMLREDLQYADTRQV